MATDSLLRQQDGLARSSFQREVLESTGVGAYSRQTMAHLRE